MQIKVYRKQLGKRRGGVAEETYEISDQVHTVRELITDLVERAVVDFNRRVEQGQTDGEGLLPYLTGTEVKERAEAGKVAFGAIANENRQAADQAVENALQSFEDGLYRIFINEQAAERLEQTVTLTEKDSLTFVRLTMLAGRMW